MRGRLDEIHARGAELVVIGNGTPQMAAAFRAEQSVTFPVLCDPGLAAYRAAGLKRGILATFAPGALTRGFRAWRSGFRQGSTLGDPWQQGGAFVLDRGGAVRYAFVSDASGHHPHQDELLAALP